MITSCSGHTSRKSTPRYTTYPEHRLGHSSVIYALHRAYALGRPLNKWADAVISKLQARSAPSRDLMTRQHRMPHRLPGQAASSLPFVNLLPLPLQPLLLPLRHNYFALTGRGDRAFP